MLASTLSGPVALTDHLNKLLVSLQKGVSLGGHAEHRATNEADINFFGADDPSRSEMKSEGVDNPVGREVQALWSNGLVADDLEVEKLDDDTLHVGN